MSAHIFVDDYIDPDVAYLLGLIVARGTIIESRGQYRVVIEFPYQNLHIEVEDDQGSAQVFNQPQSIELGLSRIRERILELLNCDVSIQDSGNSFDLALSLPRRTIGWRNILLQLDNKTSFRTMGVPRILFEDAITTDIRMEFVRGFADVAGNIRPANRYIDGRNRVRLDVLNDNWQLPIQLCSLLQKHLDVPIQNITWGHPNMGRDFREHQINIFVTPFDRIGFSFEHKQQVLSILIERDKDQRDVYPPCPGRRKIRKTKPADPNEKSDRLPVEARGHFDAYWQICKAMGCQIEPSLGPLFEQGLEEDVEET